MSTLHPTQDQNSESDSTKSPRMKRVKDPAKTQLFYQFCLVITVLCGFGAFILGVFGLASYFGGETEKGILLLALALFCGLLISIIRSLPFISVPMTQEEIIRENASIFFAMRCRLLTQSLLSLIVGLIILVLNSPQQISLENLNYVTLILISLCAAFAILNFVSAITLKRFYRLSFWLACISSYMSLLVFVPYLGFISQFFFREWTWFQDLKKVAPYFHGEPLPE